MQPTDYWFLDGDGPGAGEEGSWLALCVTDQGQEPDD